MELKQVIKRLKVMKSDHSKDVQERNFDVSGVNICVVNYSHDTKLFEIRQKRNDSRFVFDDLGLAAVEIYKELF